mgnify:FL=1
MTKTLRMKFIVTAMTAVSILLILLIGGINIANFSVNERMTRDFLKVLAENGGSLSDREPPDELKERPADLFRFQENGRQPAPMEYFWAETDGAGMVVSCDVSHMSSFTVKEAEAYIGRIAVLNQPWGRDDGMRYFISESESGKGNLVVVADISNQLRSELRVLLLSLAAGAAGWFFMLILISLLSGRAVRPIVENMEKQKRFITDAGHEIKTPLAIIMANTDALELHQGETKWSRNIRGQTERLSGLMQNLLTLSRMDEGTAETLMSECSLSEMTRDAVAQFREPAENRGISVLCDIAENVTVTGDKVRLLQLLTILLDNAVKYAEGVTPEIRVSVSRQERTAVLRISNTCFLGQDEDPGKWFERFYRGDSARTQKSGGYGIGLSAASAIVRLHKGSVKAEYEDGRVVFTVVLHL